MAPPPASDAGGEPFYGSRLFPQHAAKLAASAVSVEVAAERSYRSADTKAAMGSVGFSTAQRRPPALVIPLWNVWGDNAGYQCRPDEPRVVNGRIVKYETVKGQPMLLDVPPGSQPHLDNPQIPLVITEGPIKADALVSAGACAVSLLGVWSWRGTNGDGGKVALPDFEAVALNGRRVLIAFDSDVVTKPQVHAAMVRLAALLKTRTAEVFFSYLPSGDLGVKVGVDDFLAAGHSIDDLWATASDELRHGDTPDDGPEPYKPPPRRGLAEVERAFSRWLAEPDYGAIRANLAAVVANRADGDPVWLLTIAPPSAGKTETIMPLAALPDVIVTGRLTCPALLSGTSTKERASDATGGLLRTIGDHGILLCKDFGAILSMSRDVRAEVLQALRDVFDGHYDRAVGVDGGRQLVWEGRCGFIGGTTEAIDTHHAVIAALGDRYMSIRLELPDPVTQATAAIKGGGDEAQMRHDLGETVGGFLGHLEPLNVTVDEATVDYLAELATLAVRCRSNVERDPYSSREIVNVPSPEQPARFAKQLAKTFAALLHIGCDRDDAWKIVIRICLDSMPTGRRKVLEHLVDADGTSSTTTVGVSISLPSTVAKRHLEDLEAHRLVTRRALGPGKADMWEMSAWCRGCWPGSEGEPEMATPPGTEGRGAPQDPQQGEPEMATPPVTECAASPSSKSYIQLITDERDFSGLPPVAGANGGRVRVRVDP